jgi:transcriptional activator HAC1
MEQLISSLDVMVDATGTVDISQLTISPEATTLQPDEIKIDETDLEEKKPSKKRKSWGQELPTPKTNLPPRCVSTFSDCVNDGMLTRMTQETS